MALLLTLQLLPLQPVAVAAANRLQPTEKSPLKSVEFFQNICVSHDTVTTLLGHVFVWFAEECTWTARATLPAQGGKYPDKKGPLLIFDC